ncbi:MAG: hypothetical protein NC218_10945 [Acetobacter sp.]|nr:hypothetical protein [Acetobacter sp.]
MVKYLFKSASILAFLAFLFWSADHRSIFVLQVSDKIYALPIYEAMMYLFALFALIEFTLKGVQMLDQMLKKDVLISNHSFAGDKENIEIIQQNSNNKIVLSRNQFDEAAILIVKTMSAITAGLMDDARRHLASLKEIIGEDAIIDMLKLKIYKGEKNFDKMEQLSQKLMENEDIQLVGMKAALEAQMEKKEFTEALKTVNQAFEVRQDLYWVIGSAFLLRAQNNDWLGALEVLEAGIEKNITPPQKASRLKAVALYELAKQAKADKDKTKYFKFITQALNENNKLIPAALDLAEYYVKNDKQTRKAENVLYRMWVENPSYEIAEAYLNLFPKDSKAEKIQRMEKLALVNNKRQSLNNLILAELYIKAKKFAKAKTECKIFLLKNPATQKIADMYKEMDEKTHKNGAVKSGNFINSIKKRLDEMSKGENLEAFPKDFQWVCANCGHIENIWQPICPDCGEIGRNYWHLYVDNESTAVEEI